MIVDGEANGVELVRTSSGLGLMECLGRRPARPHGLGLEAQQSSRRESKQGKVTLTPSRTDTPRHTVTRVSGPGIPARAQPCRPLVAWKRQSREAIPFASNLVRTRSLLYLRGSKQTIQAADKPWELQEISSVVDKSTRCWALRSGSPRTPSQPSPSVNPGLGWANRLPDHGTPHLRITLPCPPVRPTLSASCKSDDSCPCRCIDTYVHTYVQLV